MPTNEQAPRTLKPLTETPDYSPFDRPWTLQGIKVLIEYAESGPELSAMEKDLVDCAKALAALLAAPQGAQEPEKTEELSRCVEPQPAVETLTHAATTEVDRG